MKISISRSAVVISCSAILGLGVGGGVVAMAEGNSDSSPESATGKNYDELSGPTNTDGEQVPFDQNRLTKTPWETNSFGLTVGEPTRADVEAGNLPDLMSTITADGEPGYYLSEEVYPYPDDLAKQTAELANDSGEEIQKIYGPDGKTVLGERVVSVATETNDKGVKRSPNGAIIESE